MLLRTAENSFRKGLNALRNGQTTEALAYFEASLHHDRTINAARPTMKYRSYYGLCLALTTDRQREALELCRQAARAEFYSPDVFWNLGRVALLCGDRRAAWKAFHRGLQIDSSHAGLRYEVRRMGVRKRPLVPFLDRTHAVNRMAGRLRRNLGPAPA